MSDTNILVPLVTIIIGIIILGALLPGIMDNLSFSNVTTAYNSGSFSILQSAVLQSYTSTTNTSAVLMTWDITPIEGRFVDYATLCFTPESLITSTNFMNVSRINNRTWAGATLTNMGQNTTTFARTNSVSVPITTSGSRQCVDVTTQVNVDSSLSKTSIEISNFNVTVSYALIGGVYDGATSGLWIQNTSTITTSNRTGITGLTLTAQVSKPIGGALSAVYNLVGIVLVLVILMAVIAFAL
jgi:hypothetical protein